jgi:hypothetical protein
MSSRVERGVVVNAPEASAPRRWRVVLFRVLAALMGLFFTFAGVSNAAAPWALLVSTGEPHQEWHRWFIAVSGAVDLILAVGLLALAYRPRLTLVIVDDAVAVVIAAAINVPFVPTFAVIIAAGALPLVAYPYWRDVRGFRRWWARYDRSTLVLAAVPAVVLVVTAVVAMGRQVAGSDAAAQANWWADYAEHATLLGLAGVLVASRGPGWRILATMTAAAWLYLGFVAAVVLPEYVGSWGRVGGVAAVAVGLGMAVATWRPVAHPLVPAPQAAVP